MGSLANAAALARDAAFKDMAFAALVYQARVVLTEVESTPNHTFRKAFAQSVLRQPEGYQSTTTWVMACDPAIASLGATAASVPEAALLSAVLKAWDYLAMLTA